VSGIVGIINLDCAPVDRQLLWRMTGLMSDRGPDAQDIWIDGPVGFGHTLLRTTAESRHERQPCSLEGQVWITADARVDGRTDLIQKLEARGRRVSKAAPDVELILHAYHVWGEDCVEHLIGDFAFAIWDADRRRLFCARDHFGVKPFYFAQVGGCFVISNTLDCVRMHPAVSDELNEQVIGDFLLFGTNEDPAATVFADIQRLPAAHHLTWSAGTLSLNRYWTLPINEPTRYRKASDYVDQFSELLETAVADRLRTDRVAVFMSGGIDSSTIAAVAHKLLSRDSAPYDLRAFTTVYDRLIPDEERHYSGLVAEALGIPIHYLVADDYRLYERWDQPELRSPEPVNDPLAALSVDQYRQVSSQSRVALTGEGGDVVFRPSLSYLINLLKDLRLWRLVADVGHHLWSHRRLPRIGLRTRLRRWVVKNPWQFPYPAWLNRDFEARHNLPARWEQINEEPTFVHPHRPEAYQLITAPFWPSLFESYDPCSTLSPVEVRHPLFDLRLVNFALALPSMPWCVDKGLVRAAVRHILPEPVRLRLKTPLAGDPLVELLRRPNSQWVDHFSPLPELSKYLNRDAIPHVTGVTLGTTQSWSNLLPLSLNYWLYHQASTEHRSESEWEGKYDEANK